VKWPSFGVSLTGFNGVVSALDHAVEIGISFPPSGAWGSPAATGSCRQLQLPVAIRRSPAGAAYPASRHIATRCAPEPRDTSQAARRTNHRSLILLQSPGSSSPSIGPPGEGPLRVTVLRIGQHIHNGRLPGCQGRRNGPTNVTGPFRSGPKAIEGLGDFAEVLRAEGHRS
jgi:hypothetical protein